MAERNLSGSDEKNSCRRVNSFLEFNDIDRRHDSVLILIESSREQFGRRERLFD